MSKGGEHGDTEGVASKQPGAFPHLYKAVMLADLLKKAVGK